MDQLKFSGFITLDIDGEDFILREGVLNQEMYQVRHTHVNIQGLLKSNGLLQYLLYYSMLFSLSQHLQMFQ